MTLNELELTFANLRHAWREDWPGMPKVVQACLDQLGMQNQSGLAPIQAIHRCLQSLSVQMEQEGHELALKNQEPPYHNRLHTADTLVALTTLLLHSRALDPKPLKSPSQFEWLGMLAMLGHDFRHPGQVNRFAQDIELTTVAQLRPLMTECGVQASNQELVAELILFTDPLQAPPLHQKWRGQKKFDLRQVECMAILLQEADILASCLPHFGPALGESLKREWQRIHFAAANTVATPAGRHEFLRAALFTSPASLALGIPQKLGQQMHSKVAQSVAKNHR
jgi:hypothetical protein